MDSFDFIWSEALETIRKNVGTKAFDNFFTETYISDMNFDTNTVTIIVPHPVKIQFLKTHIAVIADALAQETGGLQFEINFKTSPDAPTKNITANHPSSVQNLAAQQRQQQPIYNVQKNNVTSEIIETIPNQSNLNPAYTLDNFIRGVGNEFSYVAAVTVAESPGTVYNPFFIYGAPGLGKTHLMQAIGNEILKNKPDFNVLYLTSEDFTNDFINAIRYKSNEDFRQKYRNIDVLLIDDVQFLQDKEQTQEEFFHTFNALFHLHKQIVITCDRSPKDLHALEERLVSRFDWGLITDITPPDLETRIAILKQKILALKIDMNEEAIYTLANYVQTNVRELEGALTRVTAFSQLHNKPIDSDIIHEALKGLKTNQKLHTITIKQIKKAIAKHYNVSESELNSSSRQSKIAFPRQIAMYLSRQLTDLSLPKIGEDFNRDHSTVLHATDKITKKLFEEEDFKQEIENIKTKIINEH